MEVLYLRKVPLTYLRTSSLIVANDSSSTTEEKDTHLLTYLLTYLFTYLLTYLLISLLIYYL